MEELAPASVGAERGGVELDARFGFVVGGQVNFLHKFVVSVGEGTLVLELAFPKELPVSAHFSLELNLVLSDEIFPFLFRLEVFLGLLDCGLLVVLVRRH